MKRTEVNLSSNFPKLKVDNKSLFIGSCFAQNIGDRFMDLHLDATVNPLGVIFHPVALFNLVERALTDSDFKESDFFEFQDYWFCYELSGTCAQFTLKESVNFANEYLEVLKKALISSDVLFITLGSAVERTINNEVVANCHKQPATLFTKTISSVDLMTEKIERGLNLFLEVNPNIKIYLTVSPVRHSKEGGIDNSLSKSSLILLCHSIANKFSVIEYLPIYEILVDELRDYSFFKDDLVHPNSKAVDYVWNKLSQELFSEQMNEYCIDSIGIRRSLGHKSLHPKSNANKKFLIHLLERIKTFESKFNLSLEAENQEVEKRLKDLA